MSLKRDREPVEVWMCLNGRFQWARACHYVIHRGKAKGWLTYLHPDCCERMAPPCDWRKVKHESG